MGISFQVTVGEKGIYHSPLHVVVARFLSNNWIFLFPPFLKLISHEPSEVTEIWVYLCKAQDEEILISTFPFIHSLIKYIKTLILHQAT